MSTGRKSYCSAQILKGFPAFISSVCTGTMRPMEASTRPMFLSNQCCSGSDSSARISFARSLSASMRFSQIMMFKGLPPACILLRIPAARLGTIYFKILTPTAVAIMSASAIACAAASVLFPFTAHMRSTSISSKPSLETMRTGYVFSRFKASISFSATSIKVTSYPDAEKSIPIKPRPMLPAPYITAFISFSYSNSIIFLSNIVTAKSNSNYRYM